MKELQGSPTVRRESKTKSEGDPKSKGGEKA